MRVILLKDIENIGKKYEVKQVKDGYARNFLFPKKLAEPATKEEMKRLEELKKEKIREAEQELVQAQKIASRLDGQELDFFVKIGKENQLFEAVTVQKIAKKLRELGIEVKKEQITLKNPIKELGEFPIKINLDHQLEAKITVVVEPEEKNPEGVES
jgi:large subunit ribosomal protein L9